MIVVYEIPSDNGILEFEVVENISHSQGKEKNKKEYKAYTFLDHEEGENDKNSKKTKSMTSR